MKLLRYFSFGLLLGISIGIPLSAATWKVLFYIDSSDDLNDMAFKNITDMLRGKPNDTVDFRIQLHAYDQAGLRYRVTNDGITFVEDTVLTGDGKQDFLSAARWAFAENNAEYSMLIFSNHGWGILDPKWNPETQKWEDGNALSSTCTVKHMCAELIQPTELHRRHKGFMFNKGLRTYLNNQDLIDGLSYIRGELLGGKQLDILAFDTCMGDMFEIGYQLASSVHYLVGNQSCSLRDGFDYCGIMGLLNQGLAPRSMAAGMVGVFDAYYTKHDDTGVYTHAALDLAQIGSASKALDDAVTCMLSVPEIIPILKRARTLSPRFCLWPAYTDLVAFCKCVEKQLATLVQTEALEGMQRALHKVYAAVAQLVVARCGGYTTKGRAHGVAIYLPSGVIYDSYLTTVFAHQSQWIKLLQLICD